MKLDSYYFEKLLEYAGLVGYLTGSLKAIETMTENEDILHVVYTGLRHKNEIEAKLNEINLKYEVEHVQD